MAMSDNMRGAMFMVASMTFFTFNDAFMKSLSGTLPLMQAMTLRGCAVIVALTILCRIMGQLRFDLSARDWRLMAIRAAAEAAGAYFFMTALFHMPIANLSAILQALPLSVALAAALFMREPLGWRRMTAILVGFAGVLLIIRPGGEDFDIYAVYALLCVAAVTLRDLIVRRMSREVPSVMVALTAAVGVTLMAVVGSFFVAWQPLDTIAVGKVAGAAVFVIGGYVFSVGAMRTGEIAFVAPFRYTSLLVALILGALVFDEFPGPVTLLGAFIVVVMGLFTLYRERQLQIRRRMVPDRIR
jgi:S-adenosylmethionine uptake transporter